LCITSTTEFTEKSEFLILILNLCGLIRPLYFLLKLAIEPEALFLSSL